MYPQYHLDIEKKMSDFCCRKKTETVMTSTELYVKTWRSYLSLSPVIKESLSKYCKPPKLHYRVFAIGSMNGLQSYPGQNNTSTRLQSVAPVTVLPFQSAVLIASCASTTLILQGVWITTSGGNQRKDTVQHP